MLVQQTSASASSILQLVVTLTAAPSDGSALVLAINGSDSQPSAVDGGGVAWTLASSSCQHECGSVWVGFGASSGGGTITITWSSTQAGAVAMVSEWRGLSAVGAAQSSDANGSLASTAAVPVVQTGELVFATAATHDMSAGPPSGGFVSLAGAADAAADIQVVGAYLLAGAAGSVATSWSMGNSDGWDTQIVSFLVSSPGTTSAGGGPIAGPDAGAQPDAGTAPDSSGPAPSAGWPPPLPSGALEYYVSPTGSDSATGSQAAPWRTIAHAASSISGGAKPVTIHVATGSYVLDSSTCISSYASGTAAAPITYVSDVRGGAKIDGNGACLRMWYQKGDYTNIWGFDFTGIMYAPSDCRGDGGSMIIGTESSGGHVDVGYNVFHDLPWGFAAAIDMEPWGSSGYTGAPTSVHNNVFHDIGNTAPGTSCGPENNYAMYIASGTGTQVYNNLIYNVGTIAIHCWHAATGVSIINNTIVKAGLGVLVGTGDDGYVVGADFEVSNNIVMNSSTYGIMAEANSPGSLSTSSVFLNNLVVGNQTDWYFNDRGVDTTLQAAGMTVTGTVTANPMFVSAGSGDYHLSPGSPAIDKGVSADAPAYDLDGYPRPSGPGFDIGAYEWH
jgi:hypothetical protein